MVKSVCKRCPYYKCYWRGTAKNPAFSEICYYQLKNPLAVVENCFMMKEVSKVIKEIADEEYE